jgi:peptidoglycan/xylan/chitin deacetylase (PgdA/CDA1 family)
VAPPAVEKTEDTSPARSDPTAGSSTPDGVPPDTFGAPPATAEMPAVGELEAPPGAPAIADDAPRVVISVTFDDSYASQLEAAAILEAHGLRGTFYVNSPRLHEGSATPGTSQFFGVADALALQARGHEIGGHTLSHPSLPALPEAERAREIISDRAQLLALGLEARSFAYPLGDVEADDPSLGRSVLEIARGSGYTSARDTNGFPLGSCDPGPESVPPRDAFLVSSVRSVNDAPPATNEEPSPPPDSAATLLEWMDRSAACGGGWLPLIFHHSRADCSAPDAPGSFCFDFAQLDRVAVALAQRARCPEGAPCYRIEVAPVSAVIGSGELAPPVEVFALRNPSLERTLASGAAECFQVTQGDQGTAVFERSAVARTGLASQRISIAEPFSAAAEVRIARDFGACAPFATPGRSYDLAVQYRADPEGPAPELRMLTYRLTSDYTWELWESSEPFVAETLGEWARQTFRTAAVPAGTVAFSFGLRLQSVGSIEVDDFEGALATSP